MRQSKGAIREAAEAQPIDTKGEAEATLSVRDGEARAILWGHELGRQGRRPFPLQDGWTDACVKLKPGENGWIYDTKSNGMLSGNRKLQK